MPLRMNLYVHFPFCVSKCAYCALHSRAGSTPAERAAYVARIAHEITARINFGRERFRTVYFGGGTPALCDLRPVFAALAGSLAEGCEFTVELHPRNASPETLAALAAGGVNRISMGVQALDDAVLSSMGRCHAAAEAEAAFRAIRAAGFANAGIDLIAGWPWGQTPSSWGQTLERALALEPDHVSVYSLIREKGTPLDRAIDAGGIPEPSDESALAAVRQADATLSSAGFRRYEISNWARPGRVCRHNCAVWRGEDYVGIGEGAHGRLGLVRTVDGAVAETLGPEGDALERAVFALRTAEGLSLRRTARLWPVLAGRMAAWRGELEFGVEQGLLIRRGEDVYVLTPRGAEVCDSVIAGLV